MLFSLLSDDERATGAGSPDVLSLCHADPAISLDLMWHLDKWWIFASPKLLDGHGSSKHLETLARRCARDWLQLLICVAPHQSYILGNLSPSGPVAILVVRLHTAPRTKVAHRCILLGSIIVLVGEMQNWAVEWMTAPPAPQFSHLLREILSVSNMLLSVDVGIKNLAMCVMDPSTKKINYWDVSGVPPMHADGLFPCMKRHLDERSAHFGPVKTVVIEKQPDKNRGIKSVEHFLHAYFLVHDKDVVIWDARHKIPDVVGPGRAQYLKRKKTSVERCHAFVTENNPDLLAMYEASKKKDDLADTVMQALSYIDARVAPEVPKKETVATPAQAYRESESYQVLAG